MTVEELRKRLEDAPWSGNDELCEQAIALAAELEAERDRLRDSLKYFGELHGKEAEHMMSRIDALEAENARFREAAQRPTLDVVIDSPVIGLSMVEELAKLRRENARFQWREGTPETSGWYLVTSDFNGYVSVHMCYWVKVNDSESGAWGTGPEAARRVLRWMEMPPPFRLTPSESSS